MACGTGRLGVSAGGDGRLWPGLPSALARWAGRHPYAFASLAIVLTAALIVPWRGTMDESQPGMWFLLAIVGVASLAGERGAVVAAGLAFLAWNFLFIEPYYTFTVSQPRLWFDLGAFLVVGSAVGLQAAFRKRREREARAREHETALLNHLLETLASASAESDVRPLVLESLAEAVTPREAAIYLTLPGGRFDRAWRPDPAAWPSAVEHAVAETFRSLRPRGTSAPLNGMDSSGAPAVVMLIPLAGPTASYGVLYLAMEPVTGEAPSARRAALSIATVYATYLERLALQKAAVEVDALRSADELKSGFVASVSHELKTPLASAMATVTGLLEPGDDAERLPVRTRIELEAVVDDLHRLEANIVDLLDLSRLENAAWELRPEFYEIGEVVADVMAAMPSSARARVELAVAEGLPLVRIDFRQIARALRNLTDNAIAYTPPDSTVAIGARVLGDALVVWVEDHGPGVPAEEREAVFRKFYRGARAPRTIGSTGLGLAITKEIVKRHGGSIWIEDVDRGGARFAFSLPLK